LIISENRTHYQSQDGENLLSLNYGEIITLTGKKTVRIKNINLKFIKINSFFFDFLKGYNLPSGFINLTEGKNMIFQGHTVFPFYIKVLNIIDRRGAKVFGRSEGETLPLPVYELHYGAEKESLTNESQLVSLDMCSVEDLKMMFRIASKVNVVLKSFFERRSSVLAEVKCFFGKQDERIFLVNDFSPQGVKVFAAGEGAKAFNPYKLNNSESIKTYTDYLLNFTTN